MTSRTCTSTLRKGYLTVHTILHGMLQESIQLFLAVFPDLADDTYATIGLESPASVSGIAGAADPSIVEDSSQPITPYFLTPGATNLLSNTLTGASWYVLNTAGNGLPDANLRVLIAQVTTPGSISGKLNYQVFPLGVGADQQQLQVEFDGVGTFVMADSVFGCTDDTACNYNAEADTDDGTCTYIGAGECDCDGTLIDDCGVCGGDNSSCTGCTSSIACNYNASAQISATTRCVSTPQDFVKHVPAVPTTAQVARKRMTMMEMASAMTRTRAMV